MEYDPSVWGPHYWFFLHSVGFTYPELPTDGEKKKYYNLITSLPTFIPNNAAANNFQSLIDDYPVSSYLNSKESFLKWIHFIHNQINIRLNKPQLSYKEYIKLYTYVPPKPISNKYFNYAGIIIIIILLVIIFSKNSI